MFCGGERRTRGSQTGAAGTSQSHTLSVYYIPFSIDCSWTSHKCFHYVPSILLNLHYQLKMLYHLPAFPLLYVTDLLARVKAGYDLSNASPGLWICASKHCHSCIFYYRTILQMYTKLYVYAGPDHKHAAQKPEVLTF